MTQRRITSREEDPRKLAQEQPEFGHEGAVMEPDERPRSEAERKPGNTPGPNADSHHKAATRKSAKNVA